ncbi:hypothetical protein NQ318_017778 [Aromia moschata]|uniref:Uncharacterized protein n=1 Tax=Aromia moschata TaxID=1265417 RepID=A0AAV8XTQ7_9CUCU|nr:hypothetical protein NQ318_017778 [Aromia moschata]
MDHVYGDRDQALINKPNLNIDKDDGFLNRDHIRGKRYIGTRFKGKVFQLRSRSLRKPFKSLYLETQLFETSGIG